MYDEAPVTSLQSSAKHLLETCQALSKVPDDLTFHNNKCLDLHVIKHIHPEKIKLRAIYKMKPRCAVWMEMGEENFPKVFVSLLAF